MIAPETAPIQSPPSPSAGLFLRSLFLHVWVWFLVGIFGSLAIIFSPIKGGDLVFVFGRIWAWLICKVAGARIETVGLDKLSRERSQVLVGNHTSNFDIYGMIVALKDINYRFLPKRELIYLPVFGWALWAARFPLIDRRNSAKAQATMNKLALRMKTTGLSLLAFPEGTRNQTGKLLLPFKKGSFVVAMDTGVPIVPFAIHGARQVQARHSFYVYPGTIVVEFLDAIPVQGLSYHDRNALVEKARGAIEEALLRGPAKEHAS